MEYYTHLNLTSVTQACKYYYNCSNEFIVLGRKLRQSPQ